MKTMDVAGLAHEFWLEFAANHLVQHISQQKATPFCRLWYVST